MNTPSQPNVEQFGPYLTREWLDDRQIILYTATSVSRDVIDQWVESIRGLRADWPPDRPFLNLYDLSSTDTSLTPYIRQRFQELMQEYHAYHGRTAIVIKKSFLAQLLQMFLDSQPKGPRQRKIFFNRDQGLQWLRQALTERK
ncbi:MAG: hypothetical protein IT324_10390 [Anaerolineae bacterium]|nr:hypothetical protein [Anaerolineae bacterium]